jgi:signal transduction histidine kinase
LTDAGPEVLRAVRVERLEFAYNGLPLSLGVSVLLGALTALMLHRSASTGVLLGWFICLSGVNLGRWLRYRRYRADRARVDRDLAAYDQQLFHGCLIGGVVWGSAALLFLPEAPELQFFLAFVIAGISSGAASSLSVAPQAAYAFVIPCVLPLTVRFLLAGDLLHVVMGVMTGFYMLLVSMVARRGHRQLTRLVASQLEMQNSQAALISSELRRRVSDERLRVAAEAGQIGVWEWDLLTRELIWDQRMYRMYCVEPTTGPNHYDMWRLRLHPADLARVDAELETAIDGYREFKTEFRILWPTGEERFIKAAATVTRASDGRALRVTGINIDLTEIRRLERIKSEFVSVVSHELRTPLTSVRGSLGLVMHDAAGQLPDSARELLRVAERNAERLSLLIDDLLDVERLEAGKLRLELQSQALQPLIEQALEANGPYAAQHRVHFELLAQPLPQEVTVDAKRLVQVMTNLLSNAVKFSPPASAVTVTVAPAPHAVNRARVSIRDRGPGISVQFRERIFTKFSQGDASDARAKSGTGLGLAISKGLIEQMGGVIDFELPEGGGTVFYFELLTS